MKSVPNCVKNEREGKAKEKKKKTSKKKKTCVESSVKNPRHGGLDPFSEAHCHGNQADSVAM